MRRANQALTAAGLGPITGLTNHSLRRTYCALAYESEARPAYVMSQLGHASATLSLEVYAAIVDRKRDTGERIDALLRSAVETDELVAHVAQITTAD